MSYVKLAIRDFNVNESLDLRKGRCVLVISSLHVLILVCSLTRFHVCVCVCVRACVRAFQQAEGILRAWATPALKEQYGNDPVVTKIWNTTMTEVRTDWNRLHVAHTHRTVSLL